MSGFGITTDLKIANTMVCSDGKIRVKPRVLVVNGKRVPKNSKMHKTGIYK